MNQNLLARHPRLGSVAIVLALSAVVAIDASRVLDARSGMTSTDWAGGLTVGGVVGVVLVAVSLVRWAAQPDFHRPGVLVVLGVVAFYLAHPRYHHDVAGTAQLALLVGVDVVLVVLLAVVAQRRWATTAA